MENPKLFAIMATIMMLAVGFVSYVDDTKDSDAATTLGANVDVYLVNGNSVTSTSVYAYDLYQALTAASSVSSFDLNGVGTTTANSSWKQYVVPSYGDPYYNPNENYGTLTSVTVGETIYSTFDVYVYQKAVGGSTYSWMSPLDAIGWYHPFGDYSAYYTVGSGDSAVDYSLSAAAIAIVINNGSAPYFSARTPMGIYNDTDGCLYQFYLKGDSATGAIGKNVRLYNQYTEQYYTHALTSTDLEQGITIYGWGSNAHEALKVAVCGNLDAEEMYAKYNPIDSTTGYYTYYGWYNSILGVSTQIIDNGDGTYTYHWWETSTVNGSVVTSTQFSLAYYSGLSGADLGNECTTFEIEYK